MSRRKVIPLADQIISWAIAAPLLDVEKLVSLLQGILAGRRQSAVDEVRRADLPTAPGPGPVRRRKARLPGVEDETLGNA